MLITVIDVNEPPTALTPTIINIYEDVSVGSTIATFSATDPDIGQTLTFGVVGDTSRFSTTRHRREERRDLGRFLFHHQA